MSGDVLTGPTDSISPWTIKAFPHELRNVVVEASRRDGVTVGQWLERMVRAYAESGAVPSQPTTTLTTPQALEFAVRLAELTEDQRRDPLVRTARVTVRNALLTLRRSISRPMLARPE